MLARSVIAIFGLLEVLMPKRVARATVGLLCENPEDVQIRSWVSTAVRLEGLMLLGFVLWRSRDRFAELRESVGVPSELDVVEDVTVEPDIAVESEEEAPELRPETTRFTIASALYHADDPLAVSDIVELAEGTDWEVGRSTASATLYRMYRDGLVDRSEREDGRGYVYWLAEGGEDALERADASIGPNPFQ